MQKTHNFISEKSTRCLIMSEKNKKRVWLTLINRENVDSFSQIYYKRRISTPEFEKAVKSLESKKSDEEISAMEILDIEEELIKEIGVIVNKNPDESEIHQLYQRYTETGSIEEPISEGLIEEDNEDGEEGIEGIEIDDSDEKNKKIKVKIKVNDISNLFGQMFGFPMDDDKPKKDEKDSESFYI
jgi:hypothetical protein